MLLIAPAIHKESYSFKSELLSSIGWLKRAGKRFVIRMGLGAPIGRKGERRRVFEIEGFRRNGRTNDGLFE